MKKVFVLFTVVMLMAVMAWENGGNGLGKAIRKAGRE